MKRLSSLFYNDSYSYYKSALIISGSGYRKEDDQLLLTPILFLLRHAIELILKSFIIRTLEYKNIQDISRCKLLMEEGCETNIKLLSCHSTFHLFSYVRYLDKQYRLVSIFDDNELEFSFKVIKDIEKIDSKSDYFRYPIDKNTKEFKRKFITRGKTGIAPEINNSNFLFLFGSPKNECVVFSTKEKKYLELVENMSTLYKILQKKLI